MRARFVDHYCLGIMFDLLDLKESNVVIRATIGELILLCLVKQQILFKFLPVNASLCISGMYTDIFPIFMFI